MRHLIHLFFLLYASNVMAEQKNVMVGAGKLTCNQFLETVNHGDIDDENPVKIKFVSWAQGYISGRNKQLDSFDYKMKLIPGSDEYWNILIFGCKKAKAHNEEDLSLSVMLDHLFSDVFNINLIKK